MGNEPEFFTGRFQPPGQSARAQPLTPEILAELRRKKLSDGGYHSLFTQYDARTGTYSRSIDGGPLVSEVR